MKKNQPFPPFRPKYSILFILVAATLFGFNDAKADTVTFTGGANTCEALFLRPSPSAPVFANRVIIYVFNNGRNMLMKATIFDRFTEYGKNGLEDRFIVHTDYGSEKNVTADLVYNTVERQWIRADLRPGDGRGGILKQQAAILVAARRRLIHGDGFVTSIADYLAEGPDGRLYFVDGKPKRL